MIDVVADAADALSIQDNTWKNSKFRQEQPRLKEPDKILQISETSCFLLF